MLGNILLGAIVGAGGVAYALNEPFRNFANKTAKKGYELYEKHNPNNNGIIKKKSAKKDNNGE